MAARDVYSTLNKDFCWPPRAKGIIDRDLKFAGYVPQYKLVTWNIFGLILKNKMAATGVSLSVKKSAYNLLIIGPRGLDHGKQTYRKSWAGNLVIWFDLTLDPSFKVK